MAANRTQGTETSRREALVWIVLLSVPPGLGMMGYVSVALQRGAFTPSAFAAGLLTTLAIATLVYAAVRFGSAEDEEPAA